MKIKQTNEDTKEAYFLYLRDIRHLILLFPSFVWPYTYCFVTTMDKQPIAWAVWN